MVDTIDLEALHKTSAKSSTVSSKSSFLLLNEVKEFTKVILFNRYEKYEFHETSWRIEISSNCWWRLTLITKHEWYFLCSICIYQIIDYVVYHLNVRNRFNHSRKDSVLWRHKNIYIKVWHYTCSMIEKRPNISFSY